MAFSRNHIAAVALLLLAVLCSLATTAMSGRSKGVKKKIWCVAKPGAADSALREIIQNACNIKVDCSPIHDKQNGKCITPNNMISHASFVMSSLYNKTRDCHFNGNGLVTTQDPSHGDCHFPSHTHAKPTPVKGHKTTTWCIAAPGANEADLRNDKDWACARVDCNPIRSGPCASPNTLISHASFAMNSYYQHHGRNASSCDFHGRGLLVESNPGYGHCAYFNLYA